MRTIEILQRDHQWIEWMSECLESLVARAKAQGALPGDTYDLLSLFETFADGRHQDKEETILFSELLASADGRDSESLQRLVTDHAAERAYLSGMRVNVFGAVNGSPASLRDFVREAGDYMDVHRAHMMREDDVLLPMAARLLSPEADERVARNFEALEGGPGDPHGVHEQIMRLRQRAGLPRPSAA